MDENKLTLILMDFIKHKILLDKKQSKNEKKGANTNNKSKKSQKLEEKVTEPSKKSIEEKLTKSENIEIDEETIIDSDEFDTYMSLFNIKNHYDPKEHQYGQHIITAYNGLMYATSILTNYNSLNAKTNSGAKLNTSDFQDLDTSEIKHLAITTTINGCQGQWMYRDVSMEMKDRMNHWMYNETNKVIYQAHMALIGIGTALMEARNAKPTLR